jgi:predicted transposase YbfD/YdcC
VLAAPSSPTPVSISAAPARFDAGAHAVVPSDDELAGLLAALATVPDPRGRQGLRYRLSTLLAIAVCAMTAAAHDSFVSIGEWCQRASPEQLGRVGVPRDPFTGRRRVPSERTFRDALGQVDPAALTRVGFAYLRPLIARASAVPVQARTPHAVSEREQRRAHRVTQKSRPARTRRQAYAVDGKYLRGARRPDGSTVIVLSAVGHGEGLTIASREIDAKTNEIPEFAPLLDQIDDADLKDAVVTADAMHAQRIHADYLVNTRGAHYLLTVKNNQPSLARQLQALPWKKIPVLHRQTGRGHGRQEEPLIQVATVDNLLFPHARQVLRIQRRRRKFGAKRWSTETVYALTDLTAEQASVEELASWARGHWTVENTVHWTRDVVFHEDASQVRTRNAPAVLASIRDLIRGALHLAGYANIACARRAYTDHDQALTLYRIE